jgi:hypothetical protein
MLFLLGFSEDLPILNYCVKKENNKSQCLKSSAVEYRTRKGVGVDIKWLRHCLAEKRGCSRISRRKLRRNSCSRKTAAA